ncbi:hypothetical protein ACFOGJ_24125 [Marinibaculum pumilum]|uniref:AbiTii domain-containing protein n=1 Tax=Marinibaculum pumilum TaxID=1766165 RepID=A0ABV7L6T3_9PROT
MGLLHEIQASVLDADTAVSGILLKLRFLAARLGSHPLEDWVKYETDGYPKDVPVPNYRALRVSYTSTWSGPFGSGIKNAPIPSYLIDKHCGSRWIHWEMRQSIAAIDALMASTKEDNVHLRIDASDLILLLQGKMYEGYACNAVEGRISPAAVEAIRATVRSRILELTIELEKSVPDSISVALGAPVPEMPKDSEAVTHIVNQTIYGNYSGVTNTGSVNNMHVSIARGDGDAVVHELARMGIAEEDARDFLRALADDGPQEIERPFGTRATEWLGRNISKAANGTWKIGVAVATAVLQEAALRYYGLK